MSEHRKKKKKKKATSSNPEVQYNLTNNLDKIFEPIILARLCISFAEYLDHGLTREQLICLHKECTEIAFYDNDIHLKIQLIRFTKNIPFERRLKEFYVYLSQNKNDLESRILHYKKCIDIAKATKEKNAEMIAYFNLGALNVELHQYYDVIVYTKKCLAIAREIGDKTVAMKSCLILGKTYREIKLDGEAISYCKSCINIAKEINQKSVEMTACFIVGKLYFSQSNYKEALLYSERSLENAKAVGDKRYESMVYLLIQDCQYQMSEYKDAVVTGQKTIAIARDIGDKLGEKVAYAILGKTYESLNQCEDAIHCTTKSLELEVESDDKISAMAEYFSLGKCYQSLGRFDSAITYTMKCIDMAEENGDKKVKCLAYLLLGSINHSLNKLDESVMYLKKCLCTSETLPVEEEVDFQAHFLLGKVYVSKSQFETAIIHLKKSLDFAVNRAKQEIAYVYMGLGDSYLRLEQHDNARDYLQKCLDIAKKSSNTHAEGDAHIFLGKTFDSLHQESDAILHFKKGIEIFGKIGEKKHEMQGHFLVGKVYRSCKNYDEAIESLKKAIIIAKKIEEKNMQKDVYHEIGNIYEFMNQYDKAIHYGKKYMEAAKEIENEDDVMEAYLALGVAYLGLDEYEDTLLNLNEGLNIATQRKNSSVTETFNGFLNELHLRVEALGRATNFVGFISSSRPCLELLKESSDQQDKKCNEFLEQYEGHRLNEDYDQAIVCLKQQLALFERCAHYHGTDKVYCLLEIADVHDTLGQYENSLQCYRESLAIASHVDAKHLQAISYSRQGRTYLKLKWMNEAENSFREAIRYFESMFDALGGEDFKILLLDAYVDCYKDLVYVLVDTKQVQEALVVSDRGRARSLNSLLQKYGMNGQNEDDLEYKDIESLLSKNKCSTFFYTVIGPIAYVFIIDNERELQFSVKLFECSCACTHKATFEMFVDEALKEIEILEHVADNCENRSLDKPPFEAAVSYPEETRNLTEEFAHSHLSEKNRSPPVDDKPEKCQETDIKESALEWLHKMLIRHNAIYSFKQDGEPIVNKNVKYFGQEDEILIVPDGPLYKVPFAALRDPETGQYLSETKRIRLVPSLATLKMLQGRTEDYYSNKGALIVGNPLVGKVMFDGEETELDPLENAFAEVVGVGRVFDETPLTGEKATKQAVIQRLKQGVAVVHIAAHGSLTKGTIALAPSPEIRAAKIPDEEDYMLTMAEVQQAQVRAQLVVLSCCHSGRGEIRAEGVVSMCRAFLASGARAVVASLWTIDDEATADFMFKFYIGLMDGKSASASLQQAMNEMRNIASYSEPKYWAPFFLMGDDVTINCKC